MSTLPSAPGISTVADQPSARETSDLLVRRREPVSVICVFNDAEVRRECLDRSIEAGRFAAPETELVAVDNTEGRFGTAGAALNHGASIARHDYLAFVHQDVYLHSLVALEEAAGILAGGSFGVLGSIGVNTDGRLVGRIRDRVVLSGHHEPEPTDVDSLDEVLFMAARKTVLGAPLSEAADLAWHAYGVEYGLRMRALNMRVGAVQIPITHNSLSVNLARLDAAHEAVGRMYPQLLPVRTTCGIVRKSRLRMPVPRLLAGQRWRYRWLRESLELLPARREAPNVPVVLSDIRHEIDDILRLHAAPLTIVNVDYHGDFARTSGQAITLRRLGRTITTVAIPSQEICGIASKDAQSFIVTNLTANDVRALMPALGGSRCRLGFQSDAGLWLAVGAVADVELTAWHSSKARPYSAV